MIKRPMNVRDGMTDSLNLIQVYYIK